MSKKDKRHNGQGGRTEADEKAYVEGLRAEEPIKTEVIQHLREQNRKLWSTQATLLRALLADGRALQMYRERALEIAEAAMRVGDNPSRCSPGCFIHEWDFEHGWRKKEDR